MVGSAGGGTAGSDPRLTFQEAMEMTALPAPAGPVGGVRRFMSRRPAWLPGSDIEDIHRLVGPGKPLAATPRAGYGGHVYCQAALAASRAVDEEESARGLVGGQPRLGLHTVHGYFCLIGLTDRPFIYEVTPMSTQRSFVTRLVTARQPADRTTAEPSPRVRFPLSDGAPDAPLGPVCFTALVSFKLPEPDNAGVNAQESPAQARFADILASRRPEAWTPSPPLDIDGVTAVVGRDIVGSFPAVHMRKVDMRAFNAGRPLHEKRELLLYRVLAPLPVRSAEEANAHALLHAYEADRNGLLMAGNFGGLHGGVFGRAASLSYSFVVHTNVDRARMVHESEAEAAGEARWWIQEVSFPRAAAGRAVLESKIWSPDGVHVATEYQDGLCGTRDEAKMNAGGRKNIKL